MKRTRSVVDKLRRRHMIHGGRYTDDLEWLAKRFEVALKQINEKCVYYERTGQEINGDEIGDIIVKALDIFDT